MTRRYRARQRIPAEQRFWAKVNKTSDCWLWTGTSEGYARFWDGTRTVGAHRFSYELLVGEIPSGMQIDHRATCSKRCVNPDHLRLVTNKQNAENRAAAQSNSKSGVRGVIWHGNRWKAGVRHNGHTVWVGSFDTIEEASEAVRLKRIELFTHNDMDKEQT